jgi:peptidoglycan/xylan/chitin deacetylase (PgdA/CDA1 family)
VPSPVAASATAPAPTVATCLAAAPQLRGQTNACVKLAQVLLDRQGFGRPLEADGIFGAGTQAAVTALQTKRHLTVTGKLDAATWRSLATGPNVPYPTPNPPPPSKVNCAVQACIALTFDDGPVTQTAELLDTLKRKQAKATFFVVGESAARHPEILRRMVAEGHVVGNHTMTHAWLTRLGTDAVRKEITGVNDLIKNATGQMPRLFRPPYGATNATVASVTAGLGMAQIMWEADPRDWADRNAATVRDRVLALARNGTIVVSHDIHATTRAAYAEIIDGLRAKGYVLVTVPELLGSNLTPGKIYYRR